MFDVVRLERRTNPDRIADTDHAAQVANGTLGSFPLVVPFHRALEAHMPVLHHGLDLLPADRQLSLQRRDRSACNLRIGGCTEERLYTDVVGNRGYALDAA